MQKRVVDLTFEELSELASQAGAEAVRASLAAGVPVTGAVDGYPGISTIYPDGTVEPFDPVHNPRPAQTFMAGGRRKRRLASPIS